MRETAHRDRARQTDPSVQRLYSAQIPTGQLPLPLLSQCLTLSVVLWDSAIDQQLEQQQHHRRAVTAS